MGKVEEGCWWSCDNVDWLWSLPCTNFANNKLCYLKIADSTRVETSIWHQKNFSRLGPTRKGRDDMEINTDHCLFVTVSRSIFGANDSCLVSCCEWRKKNERKDVKKSSKQSKVISFHGGIDDEERKVGTKQKSLMEKLV